MSEKLDEVCIRVRLDPMYSSWAPKKGGKYAQILISIIRDGKVYEQVQTVELDNFKSLGEYAFEKAAREIRGAMGWSPYFNP